MKKLLALFLALATVISLAACTKKDDDRPGRRHTTPSSSSQEDDGPVQNGGIQIPDSDEDGDAASAVVTVGKHHLTAADFTYFYVDAISEYENSIYKQYYPSFGDYWSIMLGFESGKPLDEQICNTETGQTWQDYFKDVAIENLHQAYVLYDAALASGYSLSAEEQLSSDEYLNSLKLYATYFGYDNVDAYIKDYYGDAATEASYCNYYTICALADSYRQQYSDSLTFSKEDYQAFEENGDYYSTLSDAKMVNVRHILVIFNDTSDAGKHAAKTAAEQLLQRWQDGPATEASFGELANAESDDQDGNVTNGGLYEDIYPGQMVKNFENWCFDPAREPGDTGIVETEYGYHVMYFSSYCDRSYRDMIIDIDIRTEAANSWVETLTAKTPIVLGDLDSVELD